MPVFAKVRHPFLYQVTRPASGAARMKRAMARVRMPSRDVEIVLEATHVRKSRRLKGAGTTDRCSVAVCALDHADKFPHKVEGHIDFQYSRCFVVSKDDKRGLPAECYVYEHNVPEIAKLNDSRGGYRKLLKRIEREGPLVIRLTPKRTRHRRGRSGRGRPTVGTRAPENRGRGARLRYSTAIKLGGLPKEQA